MNTLQGLFTTVLNMSITASYVTIAVILIRLLLKKTPKIFSYALWSAVLMRLICPVTFSSSISFLSFVKPSMQQNSEAFTYVPHNIGLMQNPDVNTGIHGINNTITGSLPQAVQTASANPMQNVMSLLSIVWILGIILLVLYNIISYGKILNSIKTATLVQYGVFETDRIDTPFVCGFIKPRIFIPAGISANELSYILAHEQIHIKRLDYLIKPLAFLVLIVHWFNPLIWISFALMSKDMEMSCDESVIKTMGSHVKSSYSHSLLSLSKKRSGLLTASPLAFGESSIKSRIKNVLNYKKPTFWVTAIILVITVIFSIGLISNPPKEQDLSYLNIDNLVSIAAQADTGKITADSSVFGECHLDAKQVTYLLDNITWKVKNISSPYELSPYLSLKIPAGARCELRFYDTEPTLAMVLCDKDYRYYKISQSDFESIDKLLLSSSWANALKTRDGKPRYEMMSVAARKKFEKEQIARSGDNWNFNIGVSSPWVVDYETEIDNMIVNIIYLTQTSEPAYYNTKETLTFGKENGHLVVTDYQTMYEDKKSPVDALISRDENESYESVSSIVEKNISKIMSSPQSSSSRSDYINAHKKEFYDIIELDTDALSYMFAEFEKGGQTGLKGSIMESACRSILGGEDIKYAATSPQDWFDEFKEHIQSLAAKNSLEFVQNNYPRAALTLGVSQETAP
ncbi:MAG: M56 family metallopeptidase [Bacillota bacterium]|nr:M56 family metallopeptidase [Bacillota bacterium]